MLEVSSAELFDVSPALARHDARKCTLVTVIKDEQGSSIIHSSIEDCMSKIINLRYDDVTLSNLIDKGVTPKGLDIVDSFKLGSDSDIDRLANYILDNSSDYFNTNSSES